jgi:hypothetical protein
MVQTRRRARQLRCLLRLPTDVLYKIASYTVAPGLVVAGGKNVEVRVALRKGVDAAERSRFGGIGMTVREAEQVLRTRFAHRVSEDDLATRSAAGLALEDKMICRAVEDDPEGAPERREDWLDNGEDYPPVFISSGLVTALIAYGADPSMCDPRYGFTPLHNLASYPTPGLVIEQARLLLAAGADIDARCSPYNMAGRSPFTWCFCISRDEPITDAALELAAYLIRQGCDVVQAQEDYQWAHSHHGQPDGQPPVTLVEVLEEQRTPANERLMNSLVTLITDALLGARG